MPWYDFLHSITRTASGNNDTADAVQLTQIVEVLYGLKAALNYEV